MRNAIREWGLVVTSTFQIFALSRRLLTSRGRFVVVLHGISQTRRPDLPACVQPWLTRAEFRSVLRWISNRFALLSPQQFLGSDIPGVLVTFDDGFANNLVNAVPVLEEFSCPAVFFVCTQHVEDPRNWLPAVRTIVESYWEGIGGVPEQLAREFYDGLSVDQLVECARHPLITIGSHTISHPFLSRLDEVGARTELVASRARLEELSGVGVKLLAYPTGDYDARTISLAKAAGYDAAFAVDRQVGTEPRFEIPRIGLYQSNSAYLDGKLSGLHARGLSAEQYITRL
jgi:peptidoglycan/xylan/chitin deacetylase (PgdA/CDA1 family)